MHLQLTPLAEREAACREALRAHQGRLTAIVDLRGLAFDEAYAASECTYRADCAVAHADYDQAIAALASAMIAFDRAHYEQHHGTLDGYPAWGSERVAGRRAEFYGEVA